MALRPPHLALNPPYLFISFLFFISPFLSVSLCFSLSLFWPPPFFTFFFSVSLSLSLFLFSFFLPSCLSFFAFFWFLVFVSFFLFLLCFCFVKKNNIKIFHYRVFFCLSFLFFGGFLSSFSKSPLSLFFFLILSFVFCSTSRFFFKNEKDTNFWSRGGLQHNSFF